MNLKPNSMPSRVAEILIQPNPPKHTPRCLVHCGTALRQRGIRRQPKPCHVTERLSQRELLMQHVLLWNKGDVPLQGFEIGVQIRIALVQE